MGRGWRSAAAGEDGAEVVVRRALLEREVGDECLAVAHHELEVIALAEAGVHHHAHVRLAVARERQVGAERVRHDRVPAHDDGAAAGLQLADRAVEGLEGALAPRVERVGHARLVDVLLERGVAQLVERRVEDVGLRDELGARAGGEVELVDADGGRPIPVGDRLEGARRRGARHERDLAVLALDVVPRPLRLEAALHGEQPLGVVLGLAGVAVAHEEDRTASEEEADEPGVLLWIRVHDVRAS